MGYIVMGFCVAAGDKDRTPEPILIEDNPYSRRCLNALYNPRHVPVVQAVAYEYHRPSGVRMIAHTDGRIEVCHDK